MQVWKNMVGVIVAFLLGIIAAFFINFNLVFSDRSGTFNESLLAIVLIVVAYGVLGLIFGFVSRLRPITWSLALTLPAVLILSVYILKEPQVIGRSTVNLVITLVASWLGALAGSKFRLRFKNED